MTDPSRTNAELLAEISVLQQKIRELEQSETDRKRDMESMRASEEGYRILANNIPDVIYSLDDEGKVVTVNSSAFERYGYSEQDSRGKPFLDFIHPEDREIVIKSFLTAIAEQRKVTTGLQFRILSGNGAGYWFELNSCARFDSHGSYLGEDGVLRDITIRKQAEEALQDSEERFRIIASNTPDLILIQDRQLKYTFVVNPPLGLTVQDMVGKTDYDLLAREEAQQLNKVKVMVLETGQSVQFETSLVSRAGGKEFFDGHYLPKFDAQGKVDGLIGYFKNVTDRKRVEDALRESEARFRNLLQDIQSVAVQGYGPDGTTQYWNQASERLYGYSAQEAIGHNLLNLIIPPEMHKDVEQAMRQMAETGVPIPASELSLVRKDGSRVAVFSSHAIVQIPGRKQELFCIDIDLTERMKAEEEKATLESQLQQAQKMEAIGTMAGGIAHDFNNILAAIIGYTEMALDENQKEIQGQYLHETLKGAGRAKNLVRQILTFSRQESREKKPLDSKLLLQESVKFLRASIPATIEIRQHLTDESCNIFADPTQMHQVVMNLCTNATHAMKQAGGILKIEVSTIELAKDEILRHHDLKPGSYVRLTVSDTGHGIDPVLQLRIFDPFFTTKSKEEGTGLGLSVVYGIVKSHGGAITVYSEPGKGASFNVYLPRIIYKAAATGNKFEAATGGTERILFVDDEPALVDIGKHMLSSIGYEVTGVTSSTEALDLFRTEPTRFDLLVTDMTLPKMTGIELARKIMQIRPDIPVILCSGIREADTEDQAKSLGIKAYCTKPLAKKDLSRVIRDTLDGCENPLP